MLKKAALLLLLLHCAAFVLAAQVAIYHTSDTHGYYYPGSAVLGGFLAAQSKPYLLLDSGDFASGTFEAKESKGLLSVELMNMLGYDAATIGNHEGDFGEAAFIKNLEAADFDILAANMRGAAVSKIKPYKIYNVGGKNIAVIGLARDPLPGSADIKTGRDITALKAALAEVKQQNPDAVVLLAHTSAADDLEAKSRALTKSIACMKGIDLVLGGHVHKIIQNKKINNTVFVESGEELKGLSKIILDFDDKTGRLKSIKSTYIKLDAAKIKPDEKIAAYANQFYRADLDEILAEAKETIYKYNPGGGGDIDSPLGNLITDIIRQTTGADIALHNTEGIRGDMARGFITQRMAHDVLPFQNKIVLVSVSGGFIMRLAQGALNGRRSAYQYSGLEFDYTLKDGKPYITRMAVNGAPVDESKKYILAVNDFNASGRAEGYPFKNIASKKLYGEETLPAMFEAYLKSQTGGIYAPKTGRIKIN